MTINDKLETEANDAAMIACNDGHGVDYSVKVYYERGYIAGRTASIEFENEVRKEFKMFDDLEDPSVGDFLTYINRMRQLLNK